MANKVSYLILLQDKFSRAAGKIKTATSKMGQQFRRSDKDIKKASETLDKLSKKAKSAHKSLTSASKGLTVGVSAPAVAFTANAIRLFNVQDQALAKVRTGIKSTGGAARLSLEQLTAAATELQSKTLFGDEEILAGATSTLLTFTNIAGSEFKRTQAAVLDLSARMGTDLQSSAIQLGKALNDPVANLSALSRSGIQFTQVQKDMIKGLVESGNLTKAQDVILKELNKQFGGTAEAMAKVGTGSGKQLSNALGDLNEEIGKVQFEALKPLIGLLTEATKWFANLSPGVKKFIGITILLVTTLGPVVFIFGQMALVFGVLTTAGTTFGAALTGVLLPMLPIIAAIGLLIAAGVMIMDNWEDIKGGAKLLWEDVSNFFSKMVDVVTNFGQAIADKAMAPINSFKEKVSGIGSKISSFFSFGDSEIKATQSTTSRSQTDVNVNLRAPEKTVDSVKSRTSGRASGLNLGINMALEP